MGPSRAGDDRADDLGGQEGTTNRSHRKILKKESNLIQIQIQIDKNTNTKMTLGARTTNRSHRKILEK